MMSKLQLSLCVLPQNYSIVSLAPGKPLDPNSFVSETLFSLTVTSDEISVICEEGMLQEYIRCDNGWRAIKVINNFPLTSIGVLGSVVQPLVEAEVNLFAVSTYNTDYVLIPSHKLPSAILTLSQAGHVFTQNIISS